jgi:drug/metabolite transporter (DMT)-like permease
VPALAIAFWRNAMAGVVLVPATLARRWRELRGLGRREWALGALAGLFLAGHFAAWVPSLTLTTVASATALVATQPIWQAVVARAGGARVPGRAWAGIGVAVAGAAWLSGADVTLSTRGLLGDVLAFTAAGAAALYVAVGAVVRRTVSTTTYTTVCYGTTALLLLVCCLVAGVRLAGYPASGWAKLVALTVGPQLLGHSLVNVVLRTTSPTVVALVILLEVPGAALIAALWLGQVPPAVDWPAAALLVVGIALVVTSAARLPATVPVE